MTDRLDNYYTVYSHKQGCGYILPDDVDIHDFILSEPVTIAGETIHPEGFTTLNNYLTKPVRYVGLNNMNRSEMIFYYGMSENDLFPVKYYGSIHRVTETRIFEMFSFSGGRDHIFINGSWK
jgi:hypothetical protein